MRRTKNHTCVRVKLSLFVIWWWRWYNKDDRVDVNKFFLPTSITTLWSSDFHVTFKNLAWHDFRFLFRCYQSEDICIVPYWRVSTTKTKTEVMFLQFPILGERQNKNYSSVLQTSGSPAASSVTKNWKIDNDRIHILKCRPVQQHNLPIIDLTDRWIWPRKCRTVDVSL